MNALILSLLQPPRPGIDVHGTYKRLALHIRALHAIGASISIAYYVAAHDLPPGANLGQAAVAQEAAELETWGVPARVHLIPRQQRVKTFANYYLRGIVDAAEQPAMSPWAGEDQATEVGRLLDGGFDIVVVNNLHATCALLRSGRTPKRLFVDLDDVQHLVRWRWCRQPPATPGRLLMLSHIPALVLAEWRAARLAEATFVCSDIDRRHLVRLGLPRVEIVPNAVDIPAESRGPAAAPTMLFVGGMGHPANAEAAERMVRTVFPLIRRQRQDARLLIAGLGSDALPSRALAPDGVTFLGFVPDIEAIYRETAVFVCPMVNGGGTRIKLLDAAARAIPLVCTRVAAEGIALTDGESVLLRETDEAIAQACLDLFADPERARRIGQSGRAVMRQRYDADIVQRQLEAIFAGRAPA